MIAKSSIHDSASSPGLQREALAHVPLWRQAAWLVYLLAAAPVAASAATATPVAASAAPVPASAATAAEGPAPHHLPACHIGLIDQGYHKVAVTPLLHHPHHCLLFPAMIGQGDDADC